MVYKTGEKYLGLDFLQYLYKKKKQKKIRQCLKEIQGTKFDPVNAISPAVQISYHNDRANGTYESNSYKSRYLHDVGCS